jgi:hypothetical protein
MLDRGSRFVASTKRTKVLSAAVHKVSFFWACDRVTDIKTVGFLDAIACCPQPQSPRKMCKVREDGGGAYRKLETHAACPMLSAKLSMGSEGKRTCVFIIPSKTRMARCLTGRCAVGGARGIPFVGSLRRWLIRGRLRLGLRTWSAHGREEEQDGEGEGELL